MARPHNSAVVFYLRLIKIGVTPDRLKRMLVGNEAYELANQAGLKTSGMTREDQPISAIFQNLEQLYEEWGIGEPQWPDLHGRGCPFEHVEGKGLRWDKVSEGQPVTLSADYRGANDFLEEWASPDIILQLANEWAKHSSLTFAWNKWTAAKPRQSQGDVHMDFGALPDNWLGATLVPQNSTFMENGGLAAGNITVANERRWFSWHLLMTILHELGHAVGLDHLDPAEAIMNPTPLDAGSRPLSPFDIAAIIIPYPLQPADA